MKKNKNNKVNTIDVVFAEKLNENNCFVNCRSQKIFGALAILASLITVICCCISLIFQTYKISIISLFVLIVLLLIYELFPMRKVRKSIPNKTNLIRKVLNEIECDKYWKLQNLYVLLESKVNKNSKWSSIKTAVISVVIVSILSLPFTDIDSFINFLKIVYTKIMCIEEFPVFLATPLTARIMCIFMVLVLIFIFTLVIYSFADLCPKKERYYAELSIKCLQEAEKDKFLNKKTGQWIAYDITKTIKW